ncbi:hypothetical protein Cfor_07047 [Coptotermes formosanus]|uniref:EF-hand domain-containing protein n=1 Tax=Coptotermes formosanus TaxID=36987 RepID=A0A6L2Q7F9_COPFO|nr:hypothetical protein Cfor_07047 [Coptotermes formosanus]
MERVENQFLCSRCSDERNSAKDAIICSRITLFHVLNNSVPFLQMELKSHGMANTFITTKLHRSNSSTSENGVWRLLPTRPKPASDVMWSTEGVVPSWYLCESVNSVCEKFVFIFFGGVEYTVKQTRNKHNAVFSQRPREYTSLEHSRVVQLLSSVTYSSKDNSRDSSLRSSHQPPNTTLQRHVKANRNVHIPRFYYPQGKPTNEHCGDAVYQKILSVFQQFPNHQVPREKFDIVAKACQCPVYWKIPLFIAAGGDKLGYVEANTFNDFWKKVLSTCHDKPSRFVYIMTRGTREFLVPEDFIPLVQDVVDTHPGLTFLKEAAEFHSRYVHTVIARIYYCVNRSWSGRITLPELRRSNLLHVIQLLEEEEDINQVTAYFSYEHFYVIYCKFWELDRDHDLYIDKQDLTRHSDHALSSRMIDRIFSGAVTRGHRQHVRDEKMSYTEFVWFLLSEEDKTHPTAIEYWFRCMDLDGDGYLSMYELEYFYEEQLQRMEAIGIETLPFEDCLCQMLDMIHPTEPGKISLGDLKRCKMTPIFFDTFFNLEKYLDHEQRDPFASQRDHDTDGQEASILSDWDRYAAEEYELLVAEEGANDHQDEALFDDTEGEDILSPNLDQLVANHIRSNDGPRTNLMSDDFGSVGNSGKWKHPSFTVSDFDNDDDDYAADSDDCSV